MPAPLQQPTAQQLKYLQPKPRTAEGQFDAKINLVPVDFQTTTLQHDPQLAIFTIDARHADSTVIIKEIHMRIPDDVQAGAILDLSKQFSGVKVWYSYRSDTEKYTVDCDAGTLTILTLNAGIINISGQLRGTTAADPNGTQYVVDVDFSLTST